VHTVNPVILVIMSLSQTIVTPTVTYDQPLGLYIDGKWVKAVSGKTFETVNPTNEKPIVAVHEAGPEGMIQSNEAEAILRMEAPLTIDPFKMWTLQ